MKTPSAMVLGATFALAAAFCSASLNVFVKFIGDGQSINSIAFARYFFGFILLLPWFFSEKKVWCVPNQSKIFFRSLTNLGSVICIFYSLKYLSVVNVTLLSYSFPLFVPILALIFLRVKTPFKLWLGIIIGFIGVTLVLQPHADSFNTVMLVALLAGIFAACSVLQVRLLTNSLSTKKILFYFFLWCTVITGIGLPFSFHMPTWYQLGLLFMVGVCGSLNQIFMTLALKYTMARIVSAICFSAIVFAGLLDWLIWHKAPDALACMGISVVILGGLITTLAKSDHPPHEILPAK